jgi:hypothetical protein
MKVAPTLFRINSTSALVYILLLSSCNKDSVLPEIERFQDDFVVEIKPDFSGKGKKNQLTIGYVDANAFFKISDQSQLTRSE